VGIVNRCPIGLDHFCDLGIPEGRVRKRRIHRDVVKAVARLAIGFNFIKAWCFFQLHGLLVGSRRKRNQCGDGSEREYPHNSLPYAFNVMLCITLLWYPAGLKINSDVWLCPSLLVALTITVFFPFRALRLKLHGRNAKRPRSSPSVAAAQVLPPSADTCTELMP